MINIRVNNISHAGISKIDIERITKNILVYLKKSDSDITIFLTNNRTIKELNKQYRGLDEPTDVLSFPYNELVAENGRVYLGDIIISLEIANLQATKNEWELLKEIQILIVHGILHLLDYDHENEVDFKQMFNKQDELLEYLGT